MRKALFAVLAVVAVVCLMHVPNADAGEQNALGCMWIADGGYTNNTSTGYGYAAANGAPPFIIPAISLLTLQCAVGPCAVAVGAAQTDAGSGLYMAQTEKITTSHGAALVNVLQLDGGKYRGGVVSLAQAGSATSAKLCVFTRSGNE